jgi:hypothetical protein
MDKEKTKLNTSKQTTIVTNNTTNIQPNDEDSELMRFGHTVTLSILIFNFIS